LTQMMFFTSSVIRCKSVHTRATAVTTCTAFETTEKTAGCALCDSTLNSDVEKLSMHAHVIALTAHSRSKVPISLEMFADSVLQLESVRHVQLCFKHVRTYTNIALL
jgi:hypothetical protein